MTTSSHQIEVGGVVVDVVRKNIKNLHVGVYPPAGRVRVAAPTRLDDDAVRLALVERLGWIHRQQARFEQQVRQSPREYVTGESHYFQGRQYRLDVVETDGSARVVVKNSKTLALHIRPGSDTGKREEVVQRFYREALREQIPALQAKWEGKVGVEASEVRIKRMRTRWGTCNVEARRVWLNLELAKKSRSCLELVMLHELVHILERRHGQAFLALMDAFMPTWRLQRDELNRAPLAHEDWRY